MGLFLLQVSGVSRLIGVGASNHSDRTLTEIMSSDVSLTVHLSMTQSMYQLAAPIPLLFI
jgi:hypothetical protein